MRDAPQRGADAAGPSWRLALVQGSDRAWAIAFLIPYAAVFLLFAAYPIAYGLWMGRAPSLYAELLADPRYGRALVNTVLFVALAVNLKLFLAVLLSGFFIRRRWWVKALLIVYILPWGLPAVPAYLSFHWMLIGEQGLLNALLQALVGIEGPIWFNHRGLALASDIIAYIWKWMPFWTVVFIAGRMAIPAEIDEAAAIDGASGSRHFVHITFPLLAQLYVLATLLSTVWTIGDYASVHFVSGGAPALSTDVLATLGIRYALDFARPELGVAAMLSALPILIPLVIGLLRTLHTAELQL